MSGEEEVITLGQVNNEQWVNYLKERDRRMLPVPNFVHRSDEEIVAWDDVPVDIQKKILSGTMTEEDWISDWDEQEAKSYKRDIEDVVSSMLNATPAPVAKHVHVFRKEYPKCLLKGCGALRSHHSV